MPANLERHVEPDSLAIVQRGQGSIRRNRPGAAAERDHGSAVGLQEIPQRKGLDFTKLLFAVVLNYLGR